MSLLSKFTNLFKSKNDLQYTLQKLLIASTTNQLQVTIISFNQILCNQPFVIFTMLRQREALLNIDPKPEHLLNSLLVILSNISNDEICNQLRQVPIYWLDRLMDENKESFIQIEKMITEQSTNSYIPQQLQLQKNQQQKQNQKKGDKIEDKRKARIEIIINCKILQLILKLLYNANFHNLKPKMLFTYKLIDLLSSRQLQYPEDEQDFIWIYNIQNAMQMGLKLLQCPQKLYRPYQLLNYQELEILFQKENKLHIYEAFCEYQRAKQIIETFEPKYEFKLNINCSIIDEYQRNSIKQNVKSQFEEEQKHRNNQIRKLRKLGKQQLIKLLRF